MGTDETAIECLFDLGGIVPGSRGTASNGVCAPSARVLFWRRFGWMGSGCRREDPFRHRTKFFQRLSPSKTPESDQDCGGKNTREEQPRPEAPRPVGRTPHVIRPAADAAPPRVTPGHRWRGWRLLETIPATELENLVSARHRLLGSAFERWIISKRGSRTVAGIGEIARSLAVNAEQSPPRPACGERGLGVRGAT
jgi:hypothetical protein